MREKKAYLRPAQPEKRISYRCPYEIRFGPAMVHGVVWATEGSPLARPPRRRGGLGGLDSGGRGGAGRDPHEGARQCPAARSPEF